MAINTLDQFIASSKQLVSYHKTASRTTVAAAAFSVFDLAGNPSAGTLAIGNTTSGVVPTSSVAGYPKLNSFSGLDGVISGVTFGNSVACRFTLFDCLFSAGAFAFNAASALTGQPSYLTRVPNLNNTEIWIECVTAFTGNQSIAVTYTNQDGVTGKTTGTIATGIAPTVGRMLQLPLASGDTGVRTIESVTSTVATAGTFNVHVMRRLWSGRVRIANDGDTHDMLKTGLPPLYDTSALRFVVYTDGTSSGIPELQLEVAVG